METVMWTFKTRNFMVEWSISPCSDLDLSWDESGETRENIESGLWDAFDSKIGVYFRGVEIGCAYLGDSIYEDPSEFRDHIGINVKSRNDGRNYGSYFADMVREAISEARKTLKDIPELRKNA